MSVSISMMNVLEWRKLRFFSQIVFNVTLALKADYRMSRKGKYQISKMRF